MKGCGGHLLLLGVVALLLEEGSGFPSSHALRNFRMAVSEPGPGLPRFIAVSYVDDQPIVHYDSHTRRTVPVAPWMRKVEQDEPRYFEEESQVFRGDEKLFNETLVTLMDHFHHDNRTGLHTLQLKISCKVWADGRPIGGSQKYAYEGKDLFVLNTETLTWKACVPQAKNLKKKLGSILGLAHPQREMDYLKETCVDSLRKYLVYGNKTLLRTESPMVIMARKKDYDGRETLFCQLYGFYPKEINVTLLKDGKVRKQDTCMGGVVPNSDGTFHTWLSIGVDPKDRGRYRCRVEHDSLPEPLERVWGESAFDWGLTLVILAVVLVVLAVAALVWAGVIFYREQQPQGGYASASRGSVQGSDNGSNGASSQVVSHSGDVTESGGLRAPLHGAPRLQEGPSPTPPPYQFRSSEQDVLQLLTYQLAKSSTARTRAFSVVSPALWNTLPEDPVLLAF